MKYLFLGLLLIATVWHLIESWNDNMRRRRFTKPFLIPLILLYYLISTSHPIWFLVLALIFSWLGDVFLMFQGNTWFTIGGCFFGVSHIFFVLTYVGRIQWSAVHLYVIIPVAIVYIAITTLVIRAVIKQTPKKMLPPMYLYLIANSTMNVLPSCSWSQYLARAPSSQWSVPSSFLFQTAACFWSVILNGRSLSLKSILPLC